MRGATATEFGFQLGLACLSFRGREQNASDARHKREGAERVAEPYYSVNQLVSRAGSLTFGKGNFN